MATLFVAEGSESPRSASTPHSSLASSASAASLGVGDERASSTSPTPSARDTQRDGPPRAWAKRFLWRAVRELASVFVTAVRFFTAVSGLLLGLSMVVASECGGVVVRLGRAALVRSHFQPRASLDSAMRLLRDARNARTRTLANEAVAEAERLIHEATLSPLAVDPVDLIVQRTLTRQAAEEAQYHQSHHQHSPGDGDAFDGDGDDGEPESDPFKIIGDESMTFWKDMARCWTVPHDTTQSVLTYEGRVHLRERVLRDEELLAVIDELAHGDSVQVRKLVGDAERIYDDMAAKPSLTLVRFLSWSISKIVSLFYPFGVEVDLHQIRRIQQVARQARKPLILLPTHKSHMDYLLVSYLCFMFNLPLPFVVAGDNLRIPIIGPILRRGGAFFIRRTFAGDKLYAAIFDAYVKQLLFHGLTVECFIEGGRSRAGKLLSPKTGFLRSIVKAVRAGEIDDAIVVPISISYDRVVEGNSMTAELAGGQKKAEALLTAVQSVYHLIRDAATRKLCFGRVDIGVAAPISVGEFLRTRNVHRAADDDAAALAPAGGAPAAAGGGDSSLSRPRSLFARTPTTNEIERDAKLLGYATLYHCNLAAAILPTSLVGTVLLSQYERGLSLEELVRRVIWLGHEVSSRGFKVVKQHNVTLEDSIRMVVDDVLGGNKSDLVKRHKNLLLLKLYNPRERLELTVLRNQLLHVFVDEAILCCSLYALEKKGQAHVRRGELFDTFAWLTLLLSFEFIWEPIPRATVARSRFSAALRRLEERSVLRVRTSGGGGSGDDAPPATLSGAPSMRRSANVTRALARAAAVSATAADESVDFVVPTESEDDSDTICVNESVKSGVKRGTMSYLFQCGLLWSFVDTYFVAALAILTLLPRDGGSRPILTLNQLIERAQSIGEQLFFQCVIDLFEAISKEQLQNAFQLYKHWSVFTIESTAAVRNVVRLTSEYESEQQCMTLVNRVSAYKKSARAYRSRRFRTRAGGDEVLDAIRIAIATVDGANVKEV
jgi:1-acyl-sn-glycerol-3-phosphate acyltransferase